MDQEQSFEFSMMQRDVYHKLRRGGYLPDEGERRIAQYLSLPAFDNPISWDVIQVPKRREPDGTMLFRTCWRMDLDLQALSTPVERLKYPRPFVPTIDVTQHVIDRSRIESILAQFQSIPVPLAIAEPPSGLDGATFEVFVGGYFCNARISWWCELPDEWAALKPVVTEFVEYFEDACGL